MKAGKVALLGAAGFGVFWLVNQSGAAAGGPDQTGCPPGRYRDPRNNGGCLPGMPQSRTAASYDASGRAIPWPIGTLVHDDAGQNYVVVAG